MADAGAAPAADPSSAAAAARDEGRVPIRLLPPSHILSDGTFVRLPPPDERERSACFERAVAGARLIPSDGEDGRKRRRDDAAGDGNGDGDDNGDGTEGKDGGKRRKADGPRIHPLAAASARLRALGIDEMSKAINLGQLVTEGEYVGLTNVVNRNPGGDGADGDAGPAGGGGDDGGSAALDRRLRSRYVLRRRRDAYASASSVLDRHARRLTSSVSACRIVDDRLRSLRGRWRLSAPEHGTRTSAPVRPREVVAVDVEVYGGDRTGGVGGGGAQAAGGVAGRIARRVPRFATLELDDGHDASGDAVRLAERVREMAGGLKSDGDMANGEGGEPMDTEVSEAPAAEEDVRCRTKAEPFAVADPTLGKVDVDFDPDKVPLLTLLFEIERPSTGFAERWTLSSSSSSAGPGADGNDGKRKSPDERVVESLQHSLFCAGLFESMRGEATPPRPSAVVGAAALPRRRRRDGRQVAWLPVGADESFLPVPSSLAGGDGDGDVRLLSVVHCREGEVRVQLDSEYTLAVRLVEAGTASASGGDGGRAAGDGTDSSQSQGSGSQSPAQVRTLCRALLLHSQTLYHEHRTRTAAADAVPPDEDKPVHGLRRVKKEGAGPPPPLILQSCVSLGCKLIFERKIRSTLRRVASWLRDGVDGGSPDDMSVQWLGTASLDDRSRFTLLYRDVCMDVGTVGDSVRVTMVSPGGEYRSVGFGSAGELERFIKMEIARSLTRSD